jgi:hypothetical protein
VEVSLRAQYLDMIGIFVVPVLLPTALLMYTSRSDRVFGLLYNIFLAITIAHIDIVVTQSLECIHLYG